MMKVIFISFALALFGTKHSAAQGVNISDTNFLYALINLGFDTNGDSIIQFQEAAAVTSLTVSFAGISDLNGIEAFINLDTLNCSSNQLTTLDLSQNLKLTLLYCSINKLTDLDLSENSELIYLSCSNNKLASLNVSENPNLTLLDCGFNDLTSLNLTGNPDLEILECYSNQLDSLNVSGNIRLISLYCSNNKIHSLDLSENVDLALIDCQFNSLISINLSKNINLTSLACFSNQLTSLDVTKNPKLAHLDCGLNLYTRLDLSKNDSLISADCSQNPNLLYICVKDTAFVNSNFNFYKDESVQWTETCNQPTSVIEKQSIFTVVISPNHSKESFNLSLHQPAYISIFNSAGIEVENFADVHYLQFGQNYSPGLYFVSVIFTGDKSRKVIQIVKE